MKTKTKTKTKERKQLRQLVAINRDLKREFGNVLDDSRIIDELAMSEIDLDDD